MIIARKQIGTRKMAGTAWPVEHALDRQTTCGRVTWVVLRYLCNGIPDSAESFKTKRAALEAL